MGISPRWVTGALIAALGLLALFMASRAHDDMMYFFGLMIFGFAVLFDFGLIARYVGRPTDHGSSDGHSA
ncbi:MAG: hypothetical protein H6843_04635 [Rhodospirillaceae bacterium]|nr:hypothetical protein [Rhodospirillaceae bacterium]